jgi:hypothetical protein
VPSVGDEIEFDGHIVTIEACDDDSIQAHTGAAPIVDKSSAATRAPHSIVPNHIPAASTLSAVPKEITRSITPSNPVNIPTVNTPRTQPLSTPNGIRMKKFVSPLKRKQRLISIDPEELEDIADTNEPMILGDTPSTSTIQSKASSLLPTVQDNIETPTTLNTVNHTIPPQPKRVRYGLSRPSLPTVNNNDTKKSNLSMYFFFFFCELNLTRYLFIALNFLIHLLQHLILPLKQHHKIQLNLHLLMLLPNHLRAPL